jgi:hypothetical protein
MLLSGSVGEEVSMTHAQAIIIEWIATAFVASVSFALGWHAANRRRGHSGR